MLSARRPFLSGRAIYKNCRFSIGMGEREASPTPFFPLLYISVNPGAKGDIA